MRPIGFMLHSIRFKGARPGDEEKLSSALTLTFNNAKLLFFKQLEQPVGSRKSCAK